jgi:hypothetical protein
VKEVDEVELDSDILKSNEKDLLTYKNQKRELKKRLIIYIISLIPYLILLLIVTHITELFIWSFPESLTSTEVYNETEPLIKKTLNLTEISLIIGVVFIGAEQAATIPLAEKEIYILTDQRFIEISAFDETIDSINDIDLYEIEDIKVRENSIIIHGKSNKIKLENIEKPENIQSEIYNL